MAKEHDRSDDDAIELVDASVVVKFVYSNSELRPTGKFMGKRLIPRPGQALSATLVDGLSVEEICAHGRVHVDIPGRDDRVHKGYCAYRVADLISIGIVVDFDNHPPLHVSLHFPEDQAQRKLVAISMENEALVLNETSARPYFQECE